MRTNRRQIRFGYPNNGNRVGDVFLFTPLCRYTDVTYEIPVDSYCGSDLASILQSVARIEYVHNPITEAESLALYASQYGPVPTISAGLRMYAGQKWMHQYGLEAVNYLPNAQPPMYEIDWALRWLTQYRNPIVFTPMPGNLSDPTDYNARTKYIPPRYWRPTLERLAKDHDILYFTSRDNYVPFPHVKMLLGFSMAKMAAVMHVARRHIGVESGLLHMAVAMGATCRVGVPTKDGKSLYQGHPFYVYSGNLWVTEPCRVFYHLFEDGDHSDKANLVF